VLIDLLHECDNITRERGYRFSDSEDEEHEHDEVTFEKFEEQKGKAEHGKLQSDTIKKKKSRKYQSDDSDESTSSSSDEEEEDSGSVVRLGNVKRNDDVAKSKEPVSVERVLAPPSLKAASSSGPPEWFEKYVEVMNRELDEERNRHERMEAALKAEIQELRQQASKDREALLNRLKEEGQRRQREVAAAKMELEGKLMAEIGNLKQQAKDDRKAIRERLVRLKKMADDNHSDLQSLREKVGGKEDDKEGGSKQ